MEAILVQDRKGCHCQTLGSVVLRGADGGISRGGVTDITDLGLVVSEYQQAHALLYDEILFEARELISMESWRLKDDLDLEDFGGSWLSHPSNAEFLEGAGLALFQRIQENAELRGMFLTTAADEGVTLCPKAMLIYEAHAQDFIKRALVLSHVPPGPPLREPE